MAVMVVVVVAAGGWGDVLLRPRVADEVRVAVSGRDALLMRF